VQDGSATSFKNLFAYFYYDEMAWSTYETGVWAKKICGVINCANVTSLDGLFNMCSETEEIESIINTENVTDFSNMFLNCDKIKSIPPIDMQNATKAVSMFSTCYALESVILKNINVSIAINYSNNLTVDSLVGLCAELVTTETSKTLTIGTANLNKIKDIKVKVTDENDPKKPFVISTDDDAISLTDEYVPGKGWTLK
jgi:hypothetical protein